MNIVEYWKELVAECHSNTDFDSEDFIAKLNDNIPDWKQQVKDKSLWPGLHSYSKFPDEAGYTKVIINEAGLEFAYYLIQNQWGKRHVDASLALDYCCDQINLWNSFPDDVKQKVLDLRQRVFLNECLHDENAWLSLTEKQKGSIIDHLAMEEEQYVSDLLLFKIWQEELSFKESVYIRFKTGPFRHTAAEIMLDRDNAEESAEMLEFRLNGWDFPKVDLQDGLLLYIPSKKLQMLKNIAENSKDKDFVIKIETIISEIQDGLSE